jgi:hypothetical protein
VNKHDPIKCVCGSPGCRAAIEPSTAQAGLVWLSLPGGDEGLLVLDADGLLELAGRCLDAAKKLAADGAAARRAQALQRRRAAYVRSRRNGGSHRPGAAQGGGGDVPAR